MAAAHEPTKQIIESWWERSSDYLDSNFLTKFKSEFIARFWEIHLVSTLLGHGWPLVKRHERSESKKGQDKGPDFKISTDPPIWVEAVTPGGGSGPDSVPPLPPMHVRGVLDDEFKLRILGAIRDKTKDRLQFVREGLVGAEDPYLIAINTSKIPFEADFEPSRLNRAVFGLGMPAEEYDWESDRTLDMEMLEQGRIIRSSGNAVSTRIFLDTEDPGNPDYCGYEGISGVLSSWLGPTYICQSSWVREENFLADAFELVHNPLAIAPLPYEFLKVGREYRRDRQGKFHLTSWRERTRSERDLPR